MKDKDNINNIDNIHYYHITCNNDDEHKKKYELLYNLYENETDKNKLYNNALNITNEKYDDLKNKYINLLDKYDELEKKYNLILYDNNNICNGCII